MTDPLSSDKVTENSSGLSGLEPTENITENLVIVSIKQPLIHLQTGQWRPRVGTSQQITVRNPLPKLGKLNFAKFDSLCQIREVVVGVD